MFNSTYRAAFAFTPTSTKVVLRYSTQTCGDFYSNRCGSYLSGSCSMCAAFFGARMSD